MSHDDVSRAVALIADDLYVNGVIADADTHEELVAATVRHPR